MATYVTMTDLSTGTLVTETHMDNIRTNIEFLKGMGNVTVIERDNSGSYTTSSATLTPIDSTNLSITHTTYGGPALMFFEAGVSHATANEWIHLSFDIDGTDQGGAAGLLRYQDQAGSEIIPCTLVYLDEPTSASHTFRPSYASSTGNASVSANSANTLATFIVITH